MDFKNYLVHLALPWSISNPRTPQNFNTALLSVTTHSIYYGLDLEYPPKVLVLRGLLPSLVLLVGIRTSGGWDLVGGLQINGDILSKRVLESGSLLSLFCFLVMK